MVPIRVAVLSGYAGPRTSMFAGSAGDVFSMGSKGLGKTAESWYNDAKEEVAQYDDLVVRARKIANKQVREEIGSEYIGNVGNTDSGMYRRNSVVSNIAQAEAYTPVNDLVFNSSQQQNRVSKLKDINSDFKDAVVEAELAWGSLPDPQVIESIKTVQVSTTPGWVPVVLIGAAGVAAFAVFKLLSGK